MPLEAKRPLHMNACIPHTLRGTHNQYVLHADARYVSLPACLGLGLQMCVSIVMHVPYIANYEGLVQVIAATNRADTLDPALMRSGRLDRKIEFPHPNEDARAKILQIHSRKMNVSPDVNFEELARSSDDFNAAQLKVRLHS